MLTLNMQNMKARNMEELSENLKEVADAIKDGYNSGIMGQGCIWKIEGEEEVDDEEKVFRFTFKSEVWIKAKSKDEAELYFEGLDLLTPEAMELGGEVSPYYEVEQCKAE